MSSNVQHTTPPTCDPVYDDNGDIEYRNDCNDATCASSSAHSAARSSQRRT